MLIGCIILGALYLAYTLWLVPHIVQRQTAFLALVMILFFAANGIGLMVPADFTNEAYLYNLDQLWLFKSGLAYLPLAIASCFLLRARRKCHTAPAGKEHLSLTTAGAILLIGIAYACLIVIGRYMLLDGWTKLVAWRDIIDFRTSYEVRYSFAAVQGQGLWSSSIAAFSVIPITCAIVLFYWREGSFIVKLIFLAPPLIASIMRGLANLQRSAAIFQVMLIGILVFVSWYEATGRSSFRAREIARRMALIGGTLFIVVGVFIYARSDETFNPLVNLLRRSLVTPSHTAGLYFGYFPEILPFRGLLWSYGMPVGSWDSYDAEEINLKLIGSLANGWPHNANANLLATAYTGIGWPSVFIMTFAYLSFINFCGRVFARIDDMFPYIAFVCSFYGLFAVSQSDLAAGVTVGFIFTQIVLIIIGRYCLVERDRPMNEVKSATLHSQSLLARETRTAFQVT